MRLEARRAAPSSPYGKTGGGTYSGGVGMALVGGRRRRTAACAALPGSATAHRRGLRRCRESSGSLESGEAARAYAPAGHTTQATVLRMLATRTSPHPTLYTQHWLGRPTSRTFASRTNTSSRRAANGVYRSRTSHSPTCSRWRRARALTSSAAGTIRERRRCDRVCHSVPRGLRRPH